MPINHANYTITVQTYTEVDGVEKFSITLGDTVHHYCVNEDDCPSISDALCLLITEAADKK